MKCGVGRDWYTQQATNHWLKHHTVKNPNSSKSVKKKSKNSLEADEIKSRLLKSCTLTFADANIPMSIIERKSFFSMLETAYEAGRENSANSLKNMFPNEKIVSRKDVAKHTDTLATNLNSTLT